jgi:hypothetical protein
MPYAIMVSFSGSGSNREWEFTELTYEDGDEAGRYVKSQNFFYRGSLGPRYRAIKIGEDDPRLWRERELKKFADGTYQRVPWTDFYQDTGMYEHIDPDNMSLVRFINSPEDGYQGKYTSMSPGRFIRKFLDRMPSPSRMDKWCAQMGLDATTSPLMVARTAEEIVNVYNNGPHSCMAYTLDNEVFCHLDQHPVSAYGDSDLGVAYIERYGEITARCLVWPDKKFYGRIYGDRERLLERLKENDYIEEWDMIGAKIRQVRSKGSNKLIIPYLDVSENVGVIREGNDWLILSDAPHIIAKSPNGRPTVEKCQHCGKKEVPLVAYYGPDDDYDEPEYKCMEGCRNS